MYENTPNAVFEWMTAVPHHIPDQAVVYDKHSRDETMYVVNVVTGPSKTPGLYTRNRSCAEYLEYVRTTGDLEPRCVSSFEFLVLKHGQYTAMLHNTARCR